MHDENTQILLDAILQLQFTECCLIVAIYLPSPFLENAESLLEHSNTRPSSAGRYMNIPVYPISMKTTHKEWPIASFKDAYYGYIKMDNID